ncbi:MAG: nucleotidyltransferase domain-containing protein [Planctomycetota bacterium]
MQEELREMLERAAAVLKEYGVKEVYVFGSAASDRFDEDSDIDLAVSGLPPGVFFEAMGRATQAVHRQVHLVKLDRPNPFTDYLKEKGKLVRVA